jgi:hypothetical protein
MSKFKTNSRFGTLVENETNGKQVKNNKVSEIPEKRSGENNSFKKNFQARYERDEEYCARRTKEENLKKEQEQSVKEENTRKALAPESFPELVSKPITIKQVNCASFSEKLQSVIISKNNDKIGIDLDYKNLQPGWTLITKDNATNKITTMRKECLDLMHINRPDNFEILHSLVELDEKRTNEYIEMWGYEEWVNMFRFPNYDYDYFDTLDEIYYQEMDNEEIDEEVDDYYDYSSDYDKFNN